MPDGLVFAGTPEFARASLAALVASGVRPDLVLTRPDRPAGRGRSLKACAVKRYALEQDLPVAQPESLSDEAVTRQLGALAPRAMVVAAYGLIFPRHILALPRAGCINVHASLLPRWRGAAPIEAAILAGDTRTGVSLMRMEAGVDTGPVYARASLDIGEDETAGELHDRLAALGAALLVEKLPAILDGNLRPEPQDDARATYAAKRRPADARLDWRLSATDLGRRVRAYNPVPGAWFELDGEAIKCWAAEALPEGDGPAGRVIEAGRSGVDIACGAGRLRLRELQRPSRRRVRGDEFARQIPLAGRQLPLPDSS